MVDQQSLISFHFREYCKVTAQVLHFFKTDYIVILYSLLYWSTLYGNDDYPTRLEMGDMTKVLYELSYFT